MNVRMLLDLAYPVTDGFEGTAVGDVIYENDPLGSAEVRSCDGAESFLSGGIPDLKLNALIVDFNVFNLEVDSNRCNECRGEGIVGVPEEKAGLSDPGVSYHQKFDLHVVSGRMTHD